MAQKKAARPTPAHHTMRTLREIALLRSDGVGDEDIAKRLAFKTAKGMRDLVRAHRDMYEEEYEIAAQSRMERCESLGVKTQEDLIKDPKCPPTVRQSAAFALMMHAAKLRGQLVRFKQEGTTASDGSPSQEALLRVEQLVLGLKVEEPRDGLPDGATAAIDEMGVDAPKEAFEDEKTPLPA